MLMATNSQAQSWSDLLNKDNISKVVNAITGTTESIDMTGTWNYKGSVSYTHLDVYKRQVKGFI